MWIEGLVSNMGWLLNTLVLFLWVRCLLFCSRFCIMMLMRMWLNFSSMLNSMVLKGLMLKVFWYSWLDSWGVLWNLICLIIRFVFISFMKCTCVVCGSIICSLLLSWLLSKVKLFWFFCAVKMLFEWMWLNCLSSSKVVYYVIW